MRVIERIIKLFAIILICFCISHLNKYETDSFIENQIKEQIKEEAVLPSRIEPIPIHEIYIESKDADIIKKVKKKKVEKRIDFDYLQGINSDIIAYIDFKKLGISYPIVSSKDNKDYLHTDIKGNYNYAGSLFLDCNNEGKWLKSNNLIYGHNMKNGTMFGRLSGAEKGDIFKIYLPGKTLKYKVTDIRIIEPDDKFYTIARFKLKNTISLSTCKNNKRLVVTGTMM